MGLDWPRWACVDLYGPEWAFVEQDQEKRINAIYACSTIIQGVDMMSISEVWTTNRKAQARAEAEAEVEAKTRMAKDGGVDYPQK